jgi:hypothetical protein
MEFQIMRSLLMGKNSIELEIEPLSPYTVSKIENEINNTIKEFALNEGISLNEFENGFNIIPERRLPIKDELETIKVILEIMVIVSPFIIKLINKLILKLRNKYGKIKVLKIIIDGKQIEIVSNSDDSETLNIKF